MGMFSSSSEEDTYRKLRPYISIKDGKTHVLMVNSSVEWSGRNFSCSEKYTMRMDEILCGLQSHGYEIIDVKVNSAADLMNTLILYR